MAKNKLTKQTLRSSFFIHLLTPKGEMNELFSLTLYVFHKYNYSFNLKLSITENKLPLKNNPNIQTLRICLGALTLLKLKFFIESTINKGKS